MFGSLFILTKIEIVLYYECSFLNHKRKKGINMTSENDNHFPRPITMRQAKEVGTGFAAFLLTSGISECDLAKLLSDNAKLNHVYAAMVAVMTAAMVT